MDGLELASRLRQLLPDALLIFITSHVEFALDAYELSIFRYIPKNNMDGRLEHALLDAAAAIQLQQSQSYIISNQNRLERIPLKNLLYIQHVEKNSLLVTDPAAPGKYREKRRRGAHGIQGKENPPRKSTRIKIL